MGAAIPLVAAAITAIGGTAAAVLSRPKAAKPQPVPKIKAPTVGEDTTLKPGEKVNAIMTSPQGILGNATTGRQTLLGG